MEDVLSILQFSEVREDKSIIQRITEFFVFYNYILGQFACTVSCVVRHIVIKLLIINLYTQASLVGKYIEHICNAFPGLNVNNAGINTTGLNLLKGKVIYKDTYLVLKKRGLCLFQSFFILAERNFYIVENLHILQIDIQKYFEYQ